MPIRKVRQKREICLEPLYFNAYGDSNEILSERSGQVFVRSVGMDKRLLESVGMDN